MSLDVYLYTPSLSEEQRAELLASNVSRDTIDVILALVAIAPDAESEGRRSLFWRNTTHNHSGIASAVGVYEACWRPDEHGMSLAKHLIEPLRKGLALLEAEPEKYRHLEPENGWGSVGNFIDFLKAYLKACETYPYAVVEVSR